MGHGDRSQAKSGRLRWLNSGVIRRAASALFGP